MNSPPQAVENSVRKKRGQKVPRSACVGAVDASRPVLIEGEILGFLHRTHRTTTFHAGTLSGADCTVGDGTGSGGPVSRPRGRPSRALPHRQSRLSACYLGSRPRTRGHGRAPQTLTLRGPSPWPGRDMYPFSGCGRGIGARNRAPRRWRACRPHILSTWGWTKLVSPAISGGKPCA